MASKHSSKLQNPTPIIIIPAITIPTVDSPDEEDSWSQTLNEAETDRPHSQIGMSLSTRDDDASSRRSSAIPNIDYKKLEARRRSLKAAHSLEGRCQSSMSRLLLGKRHSRTGSSGSVGNTNLLQFNTRTSTTDEDLTDILRAFGILEPIRKLTRETDAFLHNDDDDDAKPLTRHDLLEKIRQKKEIIGKLRCQPWSMRRKIRTLRLAQRYLERHESKVSKRHLYQEEILKQFRRFGRWLNNIKIYLIPWEAKIKKIESHFGSVVSSYFTFLRWILWVNFTITFIILLFVVIPEVLSDVSNREGTKDVMRKQLTAEEKQQSDFIGTIWDYQGFLRKSPLFYGYYSNRPFFGTFKYRVPLAYFLVNLFILGFSFFAILKKMAENARSSKLASGKAEQYVFNWKIFTGWDFTIGNPETAGNAVMANVNKIRESIAEYQVKIKTKFVFVRFFLRVLANILIILLIAFSTWAITQVVGRSRNIDQEYDSNMLSKNEVPIVVSSITLIFPNIFELVGKMERYHPRTALRLQLARVLALYVLNYYTLIFSLFAKMKRISEEQTRSRLQNQTTTVASITPQYDDEYILGQYDVPPVKRHLGIDYDRLRIPYYFPKLNRSSTTLTSPLNGPISLTLNTAAATKLSQTRRNTALQRAKSRLTRGQKITFIPDPVTTTRTPPVTSPPPPPWTTYIPEFGKIGVERADARLTKNGHGDDENGGHTSKGGNNNGKGHSGSTTVSGGTSDGTTTDSDGGDDDEQGGDTDDNDGETGVPSIGRTSEYSAHDPTKQCWETMIGQEICKLITMDLIMTIASIFVIDFFRSLWVRYCNEWWCWNLELTFPEYGEFKVAENVLHIINNQGMIWLGLFFAPLLPALNNVKLIILMYIRAWAVVTCNVPAQQIFRASRSSNFYLMLLLLMLFLCTLPVGYVIASRTPSPNCGPFGMQDRFYHIVTTVLNETLGPDMVGGIEYVASPGIIIPILLLLLLIIYFLFSLVRGLREANEDLQKQLVHERTEEKKKIFKLAGGGAKRANATFGPTMPDTKQQDLTHLPTVEQRRRDPWRHKPALHANEDGLIRLRADSPGSDLDTTPLTSPKATPRVPTAAAASTGRNEGHPPVDMFLAPSGRSTSGAHSPNPHFKPALDSLREVDTAESTSDTESRMDRRKKPSTSSKATGGGILKKLSRSNQRRPKDRSPRSLPPESTQCDRPPVSIFTVDDRKLSTASLHSRLSQERPTTPREIQPMSSGTSTLTSSQTSGVSTVGANGVTPISAATPDVTPDKPLTSRDIQAVLNAAGFTDRFGRPLHLLPDDIPSYMRDPDPLEESSTDASTKPLLDAVSRSDGGGYVNSGAMLNTTTTEADSATDSSLSDFERMRISNNPHGGAHRRSPLTPASVILSDSAGADSDVTAPTVIHRRPATVVAAVPQSSAACNSINADTEPLLAASKKPTLPLGLNSAFSAWPVSPSTSTFEDALFPLNGRSSPPPPSLRPSGITRQKPLLPVMMSSSLSSAAADAMPISMPHSRFGKPTSIDAVASTGNRQRRPHPPAAVNPSSSSSLNKSPPRFKINVSLACQPPLPPSSVAPSVVGSEEASSVASSEFMSPNTRRKFLIRTTRITDTV